MQSKTPDINGSLSIASIAKSLTKPEISASGLALVYYRLFRWIKVTIVKLLLKCL